MQVWGMDLNFSVEPTGENLCVGDAPPPPLATLEKLVIGLLGSGSVALKLIQV